NDAEHSLDGFAKIEYINNSPDTLRFIWFHLWPNAYRTDRTAFSDQLLENGRTDFYFSNSEDRGYINRLDFRVNSALAKTEDHPQHIDIIKVLLPQPLAPGASIELTTPFHVKLPKNFSRGGHVGKSYQVTQWYPKPAVYDRYGWHPMPYLDQGEFYSDFGNYEVKITLPKSYVVLSTGNLQNSEELQWLKDKAKFDEPQQTIKTKKPAPVTKKPTKPLPATINKEETKTLFYTQTNVHDFAWFADKKYLVRYDTIQLNNKRVVDVFTAFSAESKSIWKNSTRMVKDAVRFRSDNIGEYPYNTVAAVEAKMGFEGGMEYPCITAITPMSTEKNLESVLEHEVGHNWFQGMIGNNEQVYPWFDEGINSYYDKWFEKELSRYKPIAKKKKIVQLNANDAMFLETFERMHLAQPLSTTADNLTEANYSLIAYEKGAQFMQLLENELGREVFIKAMQQYFEQWKYKHPYPSDLKTSLEKSSGKNLDSAFALLHHESSLQPPLKKKLGIAPFAANNTNSTNALIITPVAGINMYDGFMIGAALTNYTFPPTKFQFIVAPMYGTKSKQLNGVARAS
ncbi:MAG TPA: M1 family metallopeptidase, partial [Lacibacter sp.]|nr:M1 family metallopeptidase [Lacibacter sp.]